MFSEGDDTMTDAGIPNWTQQTAREWLQAKPYVIGPFTRIPRPEIIEMLGLGGFDFAIVDLEHGPIAHNDIMPLLLAAERRNIRLIARVPGLQESYFKWLLDQGIGGLQVPHVKTADDARRAVEYSRFSPDGERGLCRFVRAAEWSNIPKERYLSTANTRSLLILQIEGKEGVANIADIVTVPGTDIIFVGPYDLSQSLGLIGQIWHERVTQAIREVIDVCARAGVAVGVFTETPEGAKHWVSLGVKYISYHLDTEMFLNCVKSMVSEVRQQLA
jgi:4-hydroxy-2-oxoheptanedioate aldolase